MTALKAAPTTVIPQVASRIIRTSGPKDFVQLNIVKKAENRQRNRFDNDQQHECGDRFAEEDGPARRGRGHEDVETIVGQFAREAAVDDKCAGEGIDEPGRPPDMA